MNENSQALANESEVEKIAKYCSDFQQSEWKKLWQYIVNICSDENKNKTKYK